MKTRHLVPLLVMLAGCRPAATPASPLTAAQAGALAQRLANEEAQKLYNCQPFSGGPAQLVQGHWTWHQLRAQGQGDMEGSVEFEADGANPKVKVARLVSHPAFPNLRR